MTLTGKETLEVLGQSANGIPASAPSITTTGAIADLCVRAMGPVWVPIGFRGRGINGTAGTVTITPSGTAGANTQTIYWTPATNPVTATRLVFANFDLSSTGEADRPSTEIWTSFAASLNFQMVNPTPPSYTFRGSASTTLPAPQSPLPHGFIMTDPLYYPLPANNSFAIRCAGSLASTTTYSLADYQNPGGGSVTDTRMNPGPATPGGSGITNYKEFDNRVNTGWTDLTTTDANESSGGQGYSLVPALILGLMPPPPASVIFFGDSIDQGQNFYTADNFYNYGWVNQGLTNTIPYDNLSRGTMQAAEFNTFALKAGILSLITGSQMYLTDIVMGLARNDVAAGHSAATVQADVAAACLEFQQIGLPVHVQTVLPNTASQDGWTTLTNQFYISRNPTTTGQINPGDTTFTVSSATGITNGMLVGSQYGVGIAPGTTITISGTTVTLSQACTAIIASGRTMNFGTATPNTYASTAITYNANLRSGYNAPSYNNNGFLYESVLDLASVLGVVTAGNFFWAVGAGGVALTGDGIHPNQAGGTAINAAGLPGTSRFGQAV